MKTTYTNKLKSVAIMAGAAIVPTAAVFISGLASTGLITDAIAGSKTGDMPVTANVADNCLFTGTTGTMAFGTYDPADVNFSTALQSTASFTVRCTKGASVTFKLNDGNNAVTGQRKLKLDATNLLNYDLYSDSGYSTAWNATTFPAADVSTGPSAPISKTVYGSIPGGQDVAAGAYTDSVTITATF